MTKDSVLKILIQTAESNKLIRYFEILKQLNLAFTKDNRWKLTGILMNIGEDQYSRGLPLINSLVVREDCMPGVGFFKWYKRNGNINFEREDPLWSINLVNELHADCFNYYSKRFSKAVKM